MGVGRSLEIIKSRYPDAEANFTILPPGNELTEA